MRCFAILLIMMISTSCTANEHSGLISTESVHSVSVTADRLEAALTAKGMTVFARIDHAENAQKVKEELRPTTVVIFGNPKIGSPLMRCSQTMGIDLPQKMLILEDEAGQVRLLYNDPTYVADRHGITECKDVIVKVQNALSGFAAAATAKD